jgi:hypothetical protein
VIFQTQDDPAMAPVDIRQFEFIHYDMQRHEEFISKLDNAIRNIFVTKYRDLYDQACEILRDFNIGTESTYSPASLEDFQARVMRVEKMQDIPGHEEKDRLSEFLLPKILNETTDVMVMRKVMQWVSTPHDP